MLVPRVLGASMGPARAGLVGNVGLRLGSRKLSLLAPTTARSALTATRFPTSTPQLRWRSTTAQATAPVVGKLSTKEWPWYSVEPPGQKGTIETERVIFSRPSTGNPRAAWAFVIVWLCGISTWLIMPSPSEATAAGHHPSEKAKWVLLSRARTQADSTGPSSVFPKRRSGR